MGSERSSSESGRPARRSRRSRRKGERRRGSVRRGLAARREEDEAPPRGAEGEVEEEALLARVAASGARGEEDFRLRGDGPPLVVEEERVGAPGARERLFDEPRDEDDVEEEAARGDVRQEREAVALEAPLPDGRLLEGLDEERPDVGRRGRGVRLDRLELGETRGGDRDLRRTVEIREESGCARRDPPGPLREGGRSDVGEDGCQEVDDRAERLDVAPDAGLPSPEAALGLGRLLRGGAAEAGGDTPPQVVPPLVGPELHERPGHAGADAGRGEAQAFEDVDERDEGLGLAGRYAEVEEPRRRAGDRRPREPGARGAEERDAAVPELRDERGLLPRRVAHEDGDPVERDAVVDGAEDLADDLARLGELGRGDDDGDLRPLARVGHRAGRRAEEALEEVRSRRGDSLARLFRLPVDRDERDDGSLAGDGREERLADAAEIVQAVDEERLGARPGRRRGASCEEGVGIGERGSRLLESGQDGADLAEERGAVGCRGGGAEELREAVGREAGPAQVGGGPRDEARHGGPAAQVFEDVSLRRLEERAARQQRLGEGRERRPRVGGGDPLAGQVDERQETQVRDPAERLGGSAPEVDAEEVGADEDVDGAQRVARLQGAQLLEEARLERGEPADEERVPRARPHAAECTGAERLSLSSEANGRRRFRGGRGPAA